MREMFLLVLCLLGALSGQALGEETDKVVKESTPRLVIGPRLSPDREKALRRYGGSQRTEAAVTSGLSWLARHQESSGGWDADGFDARCVDEKSPCTGKGKGQHGEDIPCPFDGAISALATLAFLGRGHIPGNDGDPYSEVVEKGLEFLLRRGRSWSIPLSALALAEAEAMTGTNEYGESLKILIADLVSSRAEDGAWGYATGFGRGSDVPYTALVVQALTASQDAEISLSAGLRDGVDGFLASLETKKGRLAYIKEGRRFGYTPTSENGACSAAIRELLQVGVKRTTHRSHLNRLSRERPSWRISFQKVEVPGRGVVTAQVGHLSMYRWWYGTIATFHHGGSSWASWFSRTKSTLLAHQKKRGCEEGSWEPIGLYERQTGGRVFATALCVLMLEQPYRHRRLGAR